MLLIWMIGLAIVVCAWQGYVTRDDDIAPYCGAWIGGLISCLVIGFYILTACSTIDTSHTLKATRTESRFIELAALKMGDQLSGGLSGFFFLASGWIDSNEVYIYMYRTKNGDLRRARHNAYQCTVRETDRISPRRIHDRRYYKGMLIPWEIRMPDSMPCFVVPPGTVISLDKYEID